MMYSTCLFFEVDPFTFTHNDKLSTYKLNTVLFGIALFLEVLFWLIERVILSVLYLKTYAFHSDRKLSHSLLVLFVHTMLTMLPSEMLIFFGYHSKRHSSDFEMGLVNLSWVRRIVSCVRILIMFGVQIACEKFVLADDFVSTIYLFQTLYLTQLIISIFP